MPSFVLEIFHLFDIKDFHTGKLRFPVVIADFRDTGFDGLQYGSDLMLGESSFTRGEFLRGHNQLWCGVKGWFRWAGGGVLRGVVSFTLHLT